MRDVLLNATLALLLDCAAPEGSEAVSLRVAGAAGEAVA
ncbi:hypothetical protein BRI6_2152 [plant metagenome]|uniref:Uncharacterized protein n=1 Tax=plant metagenome TaxID=1297885 RepID=A0A484RDZ9_9ZZZZ